MKIISIIWAVMMFAADIVLILRFINMLRLRKQILNKWEKRPLGDTVTAIRRICGDMYIAVMLIMSLTYGFFDLLFSWVF